MAGKTAVCVEGKLYACKKCGKMPKAGDTRYYEKIGENWIGCTDLDCFKAQGGTYDPNTKPFNKFSSTKLPLSKAAEIFNMALGMTDTYKKNHQITPETEAQFLESMFKTLSGNFKEG